jgi:hypothetical protein
MFEVDMMAEEDIENRAGLPVMLERSVGRVELDNLLGLAALKDNANLCH